MTGPEVFGVECVAAGERVVVDADAIDQIVEYALSPLPLARPEIGGIAVHGEELVLSVALGVHTPDAGASPDPKERSTKALLLAARRDGAARWALEIDDVVSFVRVRRGDAGGRAAWLPSARTADGRDVLFVDVPRMLAELGGAEEVGR
jgi:hypothetical protein